MSPRAAERLDRTSYELVFSDSFTGERLDPDRWVDHYLPEWTTPERSQARYRLGGEGLVLRIDADQPAWRTEDGAMRVSSIQTGSWSGPVGSRWGQSRHRPDLAVRTAQPTRRLWTPSAGLVEVTMRATPDPACMAAAWLVGFEQDGPEQSGEVCVVELFGGVIGPGGSRIRTGVKARNDPALRDDVVDVDLDLDATEEHTYAATWDERQARFYVDDVLVHRSAQGLDYPLELLVDLFEFPPDESRAPSRYPKSVVVRSVRGYRPA